MLDVASQGSKYLCLNEAKGESLFHLFSIGGSMGSVPPAKAKTGGGRKAMSTRGVTLNVRAWNTSRDRIMEELIRARAARDERYASILRRAHQVLSMNVLCIAMS